MKNAVKVGMIAGALALLALAIPSRAVAQRSGVEIWAVTCGRCHTIQPPARYSAKDWISIMTHMTVAARLTDAQRDAVVMFMIQGARQVPSGGEGGAMTPDDGTVPHFLPAVLAQPSMESSKEKFDALCAPCHGPEGKGDGPGAPAFNPRPASFADPEFWDARTDEDLVASITNGVRLMPAWGSQLDQTEIRNLVQYLKTLRYVQTLRLRAAAETGVR